MEALLTAIVAICLFILNCSAQWTVGTSPYVYLTTATNKVGIGTTTPGAPLEVDAPSVANGASNALFLLNPSNTFGAGAAIVFGGPSNIYSTGSIRGYLFNAGSGGTGKLVLGSRTTGTSNDELTLYNGNVGIGTVTPVTVLHAVVPSAKATSAGSVVSFLSTNDTSNPFGLRTMIYGASAIAHRYVTLQTTDYSLVDGGNLVMQPSTGNVGIGTTSPDQKLTVNGTIHSKSVIVDLSVIPDYVFKPTYKLPTLSYVQNYIDKNSHLPEVPSEAEIQKNGLNVGEMNATCLKR